MCRSELNYGRNLREAAAHSRLIRAAEQVRTRDPELLDRLALLIEEHDGVLKELERRGD
jgi:hypothetical protein